MLTADSGMLAATWLAILAMTAVAALVVYLRRAQVGGRPFCRRRCAAPHGAEEVEGADLAELVERIERVSQEAGRQIDAHCARLEELIPRAQECIAGLDAALSAASPPVPPRSRPLVSAPRPSRRAAQPPPPEFPQTSKAEGGCATASPQQSGRLDHGPDPRAFRVCELAAAGRSAIQIAEELGMPLGEVELVLNIRHFR